jgi:hypothetical protein
LIFAYSVKAVQLAALNLTVLVIMRSVFLPTDISDYDLRVGK